MWVEEPRRGRRRFRDVSVFYLLLLLLFTVLRIYICTESGRRGNAAFGEEGFFAFFLKPAYGKRGDNGRGEGGHLCCVIVERVLNRLCFVFVCFFNVEARASVAFAGEYGHPGVYPTRSRRPVVFPRTTHSLPGVSASMDFAVKPGVRAMGVLTLLAGGALGETHVKCARLGDAEFALEPRLVAMAPNLPNLFRCWRTQRRSALLLSLLSA